MSDGTKPLIVRLRNWVGDVILGLPALRLLEQHGYSLHLVARGKWAPALLAGEGWPVHVQPAKVMDKVAQLRRVRAECKALDPRFDKRENTLLLPVSLSSALESRLAGLRAVGFAKEGRTPLMARGIPVIHHGHELTRYFGLAAQFLRVDATAPPMNLLKMQPQKSEQAATLLAAHGINGRFMMICPFAGGRAANPGKPTKTWPAFPAFTAQAARELGLPLVVYPGPGEHAQAREQYPDATMLEGSDLAVYAGLLSRAALVVANDTGPGHMAAALGTPVISVLGPTTADRWAPWGPQVTVLQKPALADGTVAWPTPEDALAAARSRLG